MRTHMRQHRPSKAADPPQYAEGTASSSRVRERNIAQSNNGRTPELKGSLPESLRGAICMKASQYVMGALVAGAMFTASAASAQIANLSGAWRCVEKCRAPAASPAVITQNGPNLSLVN